MAMAWMSFSVKTPVWQLHLHVRQSGIAMPLAMQSLQVDERMSPRKVRIVVNLEEEKMDDRGEILLCPKKIKTDKHTLFAS